MLHFDHSMIPAQNMKEQLMVPMKIDRQTKNLYGCRSSGILLPSSGESVVRQDFTFLQKLLPMRNGTVFTSTYRMFKREPHDTLLSPEIPVS